MNPETLVRCIHCEQEVIADFTPKQATEGWDCPNCGNTTIGGIVA